MNSAISQSANSITQVVSETYTTKEQFNALEIGGRNLLISSSLQKGYINDSDGSVVSSANYCVSDFIEIDGNSNYCYQLWKDSTNKYWYGAHYYDSEKTYISSTYISKYSSDKHIIEYLTTPKKAAYIRLSYHKNYSEVKLEKGNKATDYSVAIEDTESEIVSLTSEYEQLAGKFTWLIKSGTSSTNFILTDRVAELLSSEFNIDALTTFKNSAQTGNATVINGGALEANSITVDKLNVDNLDAISANIGGWYISSGAIMSDYIPDSLPNNMYRMYLQPIRKDSQKSTWAISSQYFYVDSAGEISKTGSPYWYITIGGDIYTSGGITAGDITAGGELYVSKNANVRGQLDIGGDTIVYNHELKVHRNTATDTLGIGTVILQPHGGIEIYHAQGGFIDWHHANSTADYTARILESSSGKLTAYNSISNSSDRRLKKDFKELDNRYLDLLNKLTAMSYRYIKGDEYLNIGFIAQDVETAMSESLIMDMPLVSIDDEGLYSLDYGQISTLCVFGYQHHESRIKELEKELEQIKSMFVD